MFFWRVWVNCCIFASVSNHVVVVMNEARRCRPKGETAIESDLHVAIYWCWGGQPTKRPPAQINQYFFFAKKGPH